MKGDREPTLRLHDDKQLVDRLLEGDRGAFDQFFESNAQGVLRFALKRMGGDLEGAREVAQTTLCNAVSGIETYRGEASLFTWLCTCCFYEIQRHRRRRARQPMTVDFDEDNGREATPGPRRSDPERTALKLEAHQSVHLTLDQLPAHYAQMLEWKYLEELSVSEIAERTGLSQKAAESRLTRARKAFRELHKTTDHGSSLWDKHSARAASAQKRSGNHP